MGTGLCIKLCSSNIEKTDPVVYEGSGELRRVAAGDQRVAAPA